jgi:hypothetical protein
MASVKGGFMNKILFCFLLILSSGLPAKRLAPNQVSSVVHEGKKYSVDLSLPGTIQILDLTTKTSKTVTIYTVQYKPDLEKDVQDVFIKSMEIRDHSLLIKNERKEIYLLNLETNISKKISN